MDIWTRSSHCIILGLRRVKLLCIVQVGFWAEPYVKASDLVRRGEPEGSSTVVSANVATLDSRCRNIGLMSRHRVLMCDRAGKPMDVISADVATLSSQCHDIK